MCLILGAVEVRYPIVSIIFLGGPLWLSICKTQLCDTQAPTPCSPEHVPGRSGPLSNHSSSSSPPCSTQGHLFFWIVAWAHHFPPCIDNQLCALSSRLICKPFIYSQIFFKHLFCWDLCARLPGYSYDEAPRILFFSEVVWKSSRKHCDWAKNI